MRNITISLEDEVLEAGCEYARRNKTSLDALIRQLLTQTVMPASSHWLEECFALMDKAQADSDGWDWRREDLYDV